MATFAEIFQNLVVRRLNQVYLFTLAWAPRITLAIVILLVGWLCALLLKKIVSKLLKALGFDVISEKTGLKSFLKRGGVDRAPSSAIGLGFYWLIIFSSLMMAFNTLELEVASQMVRQAVFYLPKVVVGLLLLALGIFLSQFIGKFVEKTAHLANIPMFGLLGKTAHYVIIGLAIMVALNYLGVPISIVIQYAFIIFGVVPLVLSLIFLVGGRDIVAGILAGRFLLKEYKKGDWIAFDSVSGRIEAIDFLTTKIKDNEKEIIIPNAELAKKIVTKKP